MVRLFFRFCQASFGYSMLFIRHRPCTEQHQRVADLAEKNSPGAAVPRYNSWNTTPSLINSTRFAQLAALVEWVTIRMVCPASFT